MNDQSNKWIGKRTIRPDGADKVTGRAAYAADATMPGMIWAKVLRSPHPHAVIKSIDTSKAEALPGVKAVATAADFVDFPVDTPVPLGIQDMRWMSRNMLAKEKVLFHGHPIAADGTVVVVYCGFAHENSSRSSSIGKWFADIRARTAAGGLAQTAAARLLVSPSPTRNRPCS